MSEWIAWPIIVDNKETGINEVMTNLFDADLSMTRNDISFTLAYDRTVGY